MENMEKEVVKEPDQHCGMCGKKLAKVEIADGDYIHFYQCACLESEMD